MAKNNFAWTSEREMVSTLEKVQKKPSKQEEIIVGIAKEDGKTESRVALSPQAVRILTTIGCKVRVEKDAGKLSRFTNTEYLTAGAEICESQKEVFASHIVFKLQPPTIEQIGMLKQNAILFSAAHICTLSKECTKELLSKKITAIGYELIKDQQGSFPLLKAMSQIVGQRLPFIVSEYLEHSTYGKQILLSNIPGIFPPKIVLIGAGTVVENAIRTFVHLGCQIQVFDNSIQRLRRLTSLLSCSVATSLMHNHELNLAIKNADVLIFAKHTKENKQHHIIPEKTIEQMKPGGIVIDVSIDQGGGIENSITTSYKKPIYVKNEIIRYGVPNIAASIPCTASQVISNFLQELLADFSEINTIKNHLKTNHCLRNGVYIFQGILVNSTIGEKHNISSHDINLLIDPILS